MHKKIFLCLPANQIFMAGIFGESGKTYQPPSETSALLISILLYKYNCWRKYYNFSKMYVKEMLPGNTSN